MAIRGRPGVWFLGAAMLCGLIGCDGQSSAPVAPSSTALSGLLTTFSTQGDDYVFTALLNLAAEGSDVTVIAVDVTIGTTPPISRLLTQPLSAPVAAGGRQEVRVTIPNEPGRPYPATATATATYRDAAGRSGTLALSAVMPTCQTFYFKASCSPANLVVGQTVSCSGYLQHGCQPMFRSLTGDQIEWRALVPGIVEFNGGRLSGIGVGTTRIVGSNSGQTSTSTICVGPQCGPAVQ